MNSSFCHSLRLTVYVYMHAIFLLTTADKSTQLIQLDNHYLKATLDGISLKPFASEDASNLIYLKRLHFCTYIVYC